MEYIELGPCPSDIEAVQLDKNDPACFEKMKEQTKKYVEFLKQKFPIPEELSGDVRFAVKRFPHEFGSYYEAVIYYVQTENYMTPAEFAYFVEEHLPAVLEDVTIYKYRINLPPLKISSFDKKAKYDRIRNDLFWEIFDQGEKIRWYGYDDEYWWRYVSHDIGFCKRIVKEREYILNTDISNVLITYEEEIHEEK